MSVFWVHYISLLAFCFPVFLVISGYLSLAFRGWLRPLSLILPAFYFILSWYLWLI